MEGESLCRALLRFESGIVAAFDAMLTTGAIANQPLFTVTGTKGECTIEGLGLGEAARRLRLEGHQGRRAGRVPAFVRGRARTTSPGRCSTAAAPAASAEYALGELRLALAHVPVGRDEAVGEGVA